MIKLSFRQKVHLAREEAIVATVKRLLAEKGFDQMTVDEVAADVGIAKASLYKHFPSKEALAAAAMVETLDQALAQVALQNAAQGAAVPSAAVPGAAVQAAAVQAEPPAGRAMVRIRAMARWTLATQLAGQMPTLPAENSTLRAALIAHPGYMDRLMTLSDQLGAWIVQAQADGDIAASLPAELVLYTLFSRACDPVLGFLQAGDRYSDEQILDWVMATCFDGLAAR